MVRRSLVGGLLLPTALLVGACASEEEQWCDRVADESPGLARTIDGGGPTTGLLDALPTLSSLAEEAPDDVRDEWRTFIDALTDLDEAVEAAGLEPAEVTGELPAELTDAEREALEKASLRLASAEVQRAADAIEQQARDVCRTPLY